jgi:hypothetical protein
MLGIQLVAYVSQGLAAEFGSLLGRAFVRPGHRIFLGDMGMRVSQGRRSRWVVVDLQKLARSSLVASSGRFAESTLKTVKRYSRIEFNSPYI